MGWYNIENLNSKTREPSACARKYFVAASVSWFVFELVIIGKNLNILISNIIHAASKFGLIITSVANVAWP
jgi:hypothetical protein